MMARGARKPQIKVANTSIDVGGAKLSDQTQAGGNPSSDGRGNPLGSISQLNSGNVVNDREEMCMRNCDVVTEVDKIKFDNSEQPEIAGKMMMRSSVSEKAAGGKSGVIAGEGSSGRKPWVDDISDNRLPSQGEKMDFYAPMIVNGVPQVELEISDTQGETEFWKHGLILFAVGKDLSMTAMRNFIGRAWRFVPMPEIFYHDDGYFITKFQSKEERDAVLMRGPYSIFSAPLMLRKWRKDFRIGDENLRLMPIWVKFPKLPLHFWGVKSLSKIASAIGVPISTDECTSKKLRISYARVLVEMDVTQERRASVRIKDPDGSILMQAIEYEWLPRFCEKCQSFGHDCSAKEPAEAKLPGKVWRTKISEFFEEAVFKGAKDAKGRGSSVIQLPPVQTPSNDIGECSDAKVEKTHAASKGLEPPEAAMRASKATIAKGDKLVAPRSVNSEVAPKVVESPNEERALKHAKGEKPHVVPKEVPILAQSLTTIVGETAEWPPLVAAGEAKRRGRGNKKKIG